MFARHGTDAHANLKLELCSTAWDMPGSYLEVGGAGGIRTHEWRFCRPLPWATWVPRRIACNLFLFRSHQNLRFTQKSCRLFRRSRVDVEPRTPLESRDFGQLGNDLDVPVIVVVDLFADRRRVNHKIVRGAVEHDVQAHQRVFQHAREAG